MYAKLLIAAAIAIALSASHWKAYHAGDKSGSARVQQKFDAAIAKHDADALEASESARLKEKNSQRALEKIRNDYTKEKTARVAANLAIDDGLRKLETALGGGATSGNPASPGGITGAGTEGQLLGQCAGEYRNMAGEAQRLKEKLTGLQDYAKLCVSP